MANVYFPASFAGVPLLIVKIDTESGRDVAVQSPARGDKHVLQDRGVKLNRTTCEILFTDQPGQAPYLDRVNQVHALALAGAADIFSHPILGSYSARIEGFAISATADACVTVQCTILAENEPEVVMVAGAGTSTQAGLEAVSVSTETATQALTAVGLTSSLPTDCLDAVTAWAEGDELDSQQVFAEVASLTGQINGAINDLELASDITRWQAYRALIGLGYQLQRAALAATADADRVFDLFVAVPRPMIAICAEVYGASLALDRADQNTRLNRVRTPGLVPGGTTLKMIATGARA